MLEGEPRGVPGTMRGRGGEGGHFVNNETATKKRSINPRSVQKYREQCAGRLAGEAVAPACGLALALDTLRFAQNKAAAKTFRTKHLNKAGNLTIKTRGPLGAHRGCAGRDKHHPGHVVPGCS